MKVRVKLFAALREQAGTRERELELADGAGVGDVWGALGLGAEPQGLVYAVNRSYVERETRLQDGDEVAVIPPVSGGAFRLSDEPLSLEEGRTRGRERRRRRHRHVRRDDPRSLAGT